MQSQRWMLWALLAVYAATRVLQIFTGPVPLHLVVALQVIAPALFAFVHGMRRYGLRGFAHFALVCLASGAFFELLSLNTGLPFGHYYFTRVMGPKIFGLPLLLVLAYIGIGYSSWIVAGVILKTHHGRETFAQAILASLLMVSWDLAMDPYWANLVKAWVWLDGGSYFGVPLSNFGGWFLAAFIYYSAFAWLRRGTVIAPDAESAKELLPAVLLYAICAAGNLICLIGPPVPATIIDHTGRAWLSSEILSATALISLLVMGALIAVALARLYEKNAA